jgi:HPt (histidine-containing phosphotransfer) domain-containing protein
MKIPDELIGKYIKRRFDELKNIESAFEKRDFHYIQKIGHQLKGNGAMFGFPSITEFGKELESHSKTQDSEMIQSWILRYHHYIESIQNQKTAPHH